MPDLGQVQSGWLQSECRTFAQTTGSPRIVKLLIACLVVEDAGSSAVFTDTGGNEDGEGAGARLRRARGLKQVTLKDVAERAGVSESYLSQIERGRARGSIDALKRITQALGMSMVELFEPDLAERPHLIRGQDLTFLKLDEGARKALLTPGLLKHLEVFVGDFEPGGSTGPEAYAHGDSDELLLVINGCVMLELGEASFELTKGDSIFYKSSIPHRLSNNGDGNAQVVWAISPPSY
jgi:transcriptional regulator with XRE-family HTH domain